MQHSQAGDGVGRKPSERRGPVRTEQIGSTEAGLRGLAFEVLFGHGEQPGAVINAQVAALPTALSQKGQQSAVAAANIEHVGSGAEMR